MFAGTASGFLLPPYVVYKAEHLYDCMIVGRMEGREEQDTIARNLDGLTELFLKTGLIR